MSISEWVSVALIVGGFVSATIAFKNMFAGQAEIYAAYKARYAQRGINTSPPAITFITANEAEILFGKDWHLRVPIKKHIDGQRHFKRSILVIVSGFVIGLALPAL